LTATDFALRWRTGQGCAAPQWPGSNVRSRFSTGQQIAAALVAYLFALQTLLSVWALAIMPAHAGFDPFTLTCLGQDGAGGAASARDGTGDRARTRGPRSNRDMRADGAVPAQTGARWSEQEGDRARIASSGAASAPRAPGTPACHCDFACTSGHCGPIGLAGPARGFARLQPVAHRIDFSHAEPVGAQARVIGLAWPRGPPVCS